MLEVHSMEAGNWQPDRNSEFGIRKLEVGFRGIIGNMNSDIRKSEIQKRERIMNGIEERKREGRTEEDRVVTDPTKIT
jgi:hypothetical protein